MRKIVVLAFTAAVSAMAQSNDGFVNRTVLTGTSLTTATVSSDTATTEPGEPGAHRYRSLWYSWTAPSDLRVTLNHGGSTGSYPGIYVYTGASLATLCPVRSTQNDQMLSWIAVKGTTYQIATDRGTTYSSSNGTVTLSLTTSPFASGGTIIGPDTPVSATPRNDNFVDRKVIGVMPATIIAYTGSATREPGEPANGQRTLWYSYTATEDQWLSVSIEAATYGAEVEVYHGDTFGTMQPAPTENNPTSVLLRKGSTYQFSLACSSQYNDGQNVIQLALSTTPFNSSGVVTGPRLPTSATPDNDNFSSRVVLSGAKVTAFGYNTLATRESFEPTTAGYKTLWYSWGTNEAGTTVLTIGRVGVSGQNLSVYSGVDVASLKAIPLTGSGNTYSFHAEANTTYHVVLGCSSQYSGGGLVSFDLAGPGAGKNAFDAGPSSSGARVVNVSTRAIVAAGGNLIPGFVISGRKTVLVRGVGPGLAAYGVPGTLPDPKIAIYSGQTVIAENNDWSEGEANATALRAAFASTGAFSLAHGSKDAAILISLDEGLYTVMLKDAQGKGGDAIVEVYEVY